MSSSYLKKQLDGKLGFSNLSTKVNRTISEYDTELLHKLKTNVETLLGRLKAINGNQFDFEYSSIQRTTDLSFKIRRGFIPPNQWRIVKKKFRGARILTISGSSTNEMQELLIPKMLCEGVGQLPESYEDVEDMNDSDSYSDEEDGNIDFPRVKTLSHSAMLKRMRMELRIFLVIIFMLVAYFLWLFYNVIKKRFF